MKIFQKRLGWAAIGEILIGQGVGWGGMGKDIPRSCWIGASQGKARQGGKKAKAEARHRPC